MAVSQILFRDPYMYSLNWSSQKTYGVLVALFLYEKTEASRNYTVCLKS